MPKAREPVKGKPVKGKPAKPKKTGPGAGKPGKAGEKRKALIAKKPAPVKRALTAKGFQLLFDRAGAMASGVYLATQPSDGRRAERLLLVRVIKSTQCSYYEIACVDPDDIYNWEVDNISSEEFYRLKLKERLGPYPLRFSPLVHLLGVREE